MSAAIKVSRTHVWMESLGDWSWPGTAPARSEVLPPAWVPAFPPAEAAAARTGGTSSCSRVRDGLRRARAGVAAQRARLRGRAPLALGGVSGLERLLGWRPASVPAAEFARRGPRVTYPPTLEVPAFTPVSSDAAGSTIQSASYHFRALKGIGCFLVYLPPGFSSSTGRYPVLYLLPGNSQPDSAFLQVGLQEELDRLISSHAIPPLIAVMIQGGPGANNWRNQGPRRYESYVLEVQQLIDRMLPTVPAPPRARDRGRLDGRLRRDEHRARLSLPLRRGRELARLLQRPRRPARRGPSRDLRASACTPSSTAANPTTSPTPPRTPRSRPPCVRPARRPRASSIPGSHSLETVSEHLGSMLTFAGHHLAAPVADVPAGHGTR